jgi:hypothetical protein
MGEAWKEMMPEERQAARLDKYVAMPGFEFASPEAEAAYLERSTIIREAIEMKVPAQVPVFPSEGLFTAFYSGLTMKQTLYEYENVAEAVLKYVNDFQPDVWFRALAIVPGRCFDILDYKLYDWRGHGLPDNLMYHMIEGEYVVAQEYGQLAADPTDFFMRKYLPRVFGALEPLVKLPCCRPSRRCP